MRSLPELLPGPGRVDPSPELESRGPEEAARQRGLPLLQQKLRDQLTDARTCQRGTQGKCWTIIESHFLKH